MNVVKRTFMKALLLRVKDIDEHTLNMHCIAKALVLRVLHERNSNFALIKRYTCV